MTESARLQVEACVDSLESARTARVAGATRIELCAALDVGGTTPPPELLASCIEHVDVPVHVMIRPRGGDFLYDAAELRGMRDAIERARSAGAAALVLGLLDGRGKVDVERTRELVEFARPLPVTFHRAIDTARDLREALDDVVATGAARVLTSGGAATAAAGIPRLAALVAAAGDAIVVMAGGGVRAPNVARIVKRTGVREVHARCDPAEPGAFASLVAAAAALGLSG